MVNKSRGLLGWLGIKRRAARTPSLGERELAVLEVLWLQGALPAQEVMVALGATGVGLSTVQSTLERLTRKQLVQRHKQGRAFVYVASQDKRTLIGNLLRDIADELAGGEALPMISGFMEYLSTEAPAVSEQLGQALQDSGAAPGTGAAVTAPRTCE